MRARPRRHRAIAALSGALILALALTACGPTGEIAIDVPTQVDQALPEETVQQLQDAVTSAMTAAGASGAVVGVWAPWSGTWVTGLGTQAVGGSTEVAANAEFRVARVTRSMTCDVLYAVAAQGTVKLNDPVTTWVSGVPDLSDVTLDDLCDGTSGIGSYGSQLTGMWLTNPTRVWNPRELASYGLGQPRTGTPGDAWRDSDAGYVLLGLALERATGQSAAQLLQQYVFAPLDLTSMALPGEKAAKPAGRAPAKRPALDGYQSMPGEGGALNCVEPLNLTTLSASVGYTDSGVVSDITDLGRYAQALAAGTLMPKDTKRFANPLPAYDGAPSWLTTTGGAVQAGSLVGQYGSIPGYLTATFADPKTGLTVAVVLNNSAIGADIAAYLAWELAAIASKAPAASGQTAPEAGLPWTAAQQHDLIAGRAICAAPAP